MDKYLIETPAELTEFSYDSIHKWLLYRNEGGISDLMVSKGIRHMTYKEFNNELRELVDFVKQHAQPYQPRLPRRLQRHLYSITEKRLTYMNLRWPNAYPVFQTVFYLTELPNNTEALAVRY